MTFPEYEDYDALGLAALVRNGEVSAAVSGARRVLPGETGQGYRGGIKGPEGNRSVPHMKTPPRWAGFRDQVQSRSVQLAPPGKGDTNKAEAEKGQRARFGHPGEVCQVTRYVEPRKVRLVQIDPRCKSEFACHA